MDVTHIAFLRAINVGGHAVVKMAEVRQAFAAAGASNVRTFIQSGNVIFDAPESGAETVFARVRARMCELLAVDAGICFRTLDELDRLVATHPFGSLTSDPSVRLYVAFCAESPATVPKLPLAFPREEIEIVAARDRDMFIVSRRKASGMYGFPNAIIEKLGVMATTRSFTTVLKIAAFAHSVNATR